MFLKFIRRGFNWNYSSFLIWTFVIKRYVEDEIRVSSFDSVNSAIILQYGNNDKNVSYINNNTNRNYDYIFNCFQMFLWTCKKKNVAVYQGHYQLTICRIKLVVKNIKLGLQSYKYKAWVTNIKLGLSNHKVKASKFFSTDIHKIQKSNLIKSHW